MLRVLVRFTLVAFLIASAGYTQNKKEKKKDLKMAREHLNFDEYQQAIPYLNSLLQIDPNNAHYNFWLGKSLYLTYKKNQALPYLQKAYNVDPEIDPELNYYLALALHYNMKLDEAVKHYKLDLERYKADSPEFIEINKRISQALYAKKMLAKNNKDADEVKIDNMGEAINTPYAEHSPVISANDSIMVFTARRPESMGANPELNYYDEDVYVSYRGKGGEWTNASNIGEPVNTKGHDATVSLTADGKTLYLYRHKKDGGLYVSKFDTLGKKWHDPDPVGKPVNSKYYEANIVMAADSSKIFFSSNRPGGFGGLDIWVANREGKDWGEPKNLGPKINSKFDEDAPYFHPDNKTLYYSSNGVMSMGGYDIFVTEIDSGGNWLDPINMGPPVNTADDDIYFVISSSGKFGYYSSGKEGGMGEKDIYEIEFPYYPYPRRYYIVELAGVVQDIQTLDTLSALVKLIDPENDIVLDSLLINPNEPSYSFVLEGDKKYKIAVESEGYNAYAEEVTIPKPTMEDLELKKNFLLDKPVITKKDEFAEVKERKIRNVYFDFDKSNLRDEAVQQMEEIVFIMNKYPQLNVELKGHTDYYGTSDYNQKLSEKRSQSVYDYLIKQGINPSRISSNALSENSPIESNENAEGRQFNRRVEFTFYAGAEPIMSSLKKKSPEEEIKVDYTQPKGQPGFDQPGVEIAGGETGGTGSVSGDSPFDETNVPSTYNGFELHNIYFDFDKHNIRYDAQGELNDVTEFLKQNPDLKLVIYGHTDAWGNNDYNQRLSENRSQAAYQFLINQGIDASRISTTGKSELNPLSSNDNADGRQMNRRVEFRFYKDGKLVYRSQP